jgi:hypothetical protein
MRYILLILLIMVAACAEEEATAPTEFRNTDDGCRYEIIDGTVNYITSLEGEITKMPLQGLNEEGLRFMRGCFAKDLDTVYYRASLIEAADAQTFEWYKGVYGKDQKHVFLQDRMIPGADPRTFRVDEAIDYYSFDRDRVYYRTIGIDGSDPDTFVIMSDAYARDDNQAYYQYDGNLKVIHADMDTFSLVGEDRAGAHFAKDKDFVYINGIGIRDVDPYTWQQVYVTYDSGRTLETDYSRDKDSVFYFERKLDKADPDTFRVLIPIICDYSLDAENVYHRSERILGADPATFQIEEGQCIAPEEHDAYDYRRKYRKGKVIEDLTV